MLKLFARIGLIVAFALPVGAWAFTVPTKPIGFVNDYANVLSVEQKSQLEQKLEAYEKSSTNEITVVTIASLEGDTIENVAQKFFATWGIGKAGKDNGVLLLVSMGDRKTRIHTGYGVESDLTDLGTSYIQSEVIAPRFKEGDYFTGIDSAVDAMIEALGGKNIVPEYVPQQDVGVGYDVVYLVLFFILQWILAVLARSKAWWHGGVLGGAIGGGIIWYFGVISIVSNIFIVLLLVLLGLIFDYIVSKAHTKALASGVSPWYMGGGRSSSGGGFGGFGGGRSGGGGSSGSW